MAPRLEANRRRLARGDETVIALDALGQIGDQLGATGGGGAVYELVRYPESVFKRTSMPLADRAAAIRQVELVGDLPSSAQAVIDRCTSWPVRVVEEDEQFVGYVLPRAPKRFSLQVSFGGHEMSKDAEMSYLIDADRAPQYSIELPPLPTRLRLCFELAVVVDVLHSAGVVISDFSPRNVFWATKPKTGIYLIDCDAFTIPGHEFSRMQTMGWGTHTSWQRVLSPIEADHYKLALAIFRIIVSSPSAYPAMLGGSAIVEEPDRALGTIAGRFADTHSYQLPTASEWVSDLAGSLGRASQRAVLQAALADGRLDHAVLIARAMAPLDERLQVQVSEAERAWSAAAALRSALRAGHPAQRLIEDHRSLLAGNPLLDTSELEAVELGIAGSARLAARRWMQLGEYEAVVDDAIRRPIELSAGCQRRAAEHVLVTQPPITIRLERRDLDHRLAIEYPPSPLVNAVEVRGIEADGSVATTWVLERGGDTRSEATLVVPSQVLHLDCAAAIRVHGGEVFAHPDHVVVLEVEHPPPPVEVRSTDLVAAPMDGLERRAAPLGSAGGTWPGEASASHSSLGSTAPTAEPESIDASQDPPSSLPHRGDAPLVESGATEEADPPITPRRRGFAARFRAWIGRMTRRPKRAHRTGKAETE